MVDLATQVTSIQHQVSKKEAQLSEPGGRFIITLRCERRLTARWCRSLWSSFASSRSCLERYIVSKRAGQNALAKKETDRPFCGSAGRWRRRKVWDGSIESIRIELKAPRIASSVVKKSITRDACQNFGWDTMPHQIIDRSLKSSIPFSDRLLMKQIS